MTHPTREESIASVLEACDGGFGFVDDGSGPRRSAPPPVNPLPLKRWVVVETTNRLGGRQLLYFLESDPAPSADFSRTDYRGRTRPWKILTVVTARDEEERSRLLVSAGFLQQYDKGRRRIARRTGIRNSIVTVVYRGKSVSTSIHARITEAALSLKLELPPALKT